MVDFRRRGEDELGQTVFRGQSRRGRVGKRRRPTARFLETLEERTLLSFTPIAQPGDTLPNGTVYTAGTTNLVGDIPARWNHDHVTHGRPRDGRFFPNGDCGDCAGNVVYLGLSSQHRDQHSSRSL